MLRPRLLLLLLVALALGAVIGACGGDDDGGGGSDQRTLVIYSGRAEKLVGPLLERFERASGIRLQVRYGESAELAATIAEEGDASPADVFFSQDAGALGAVKAADLLAPLPAAVLDRIDPRFRDPDGTWVGTSGRARVVAYSTERVKRDELPESIFDFTDARWKGRIGFPPPNASFQAFVSAMRLDVGDKRTRAWLEGIKANDPTLLENNIQTEEAIASGEIDVGFVNHYYVYELRAERADFPVANHFLAAGDPGALVNVAGIGILRSADHGPEAGELARFLLANPAQEFFATKTFEYPLVASVAQPRGLRPLPGAQGPDIELGALGAKLRSTLELLRSVGLTG